MKIKDGAETAGSSSGSPCVGCKHENSGGTCKYKACLRWRHWFSVRWWAVKRELAGQKKKQPPK